MSKEKIMKKYILDDVNIMLWHNEKSMYYLNKKGEYVIVHFDSPQENPFYNERKK